MKIKIKKPSPFALLELEPGEVFTLAVPANHRRFPFGNNDEKRSPIDIGEPMQVLGLDVSLRFQPYPNDICCVLCQWGTMYVLPVDTMVLPADATLTVGEQ